MSPACWLGASRDPSAAGWRLAIVPSRLSDKDVVTITAVAAAHQSWRWRPEHHREGCSFSINWTRSVTFTTGYTWESR